MAINKHYPTIERILRELLRVLWGKPQQSRQELAVYALGWHDDWRKSLAFSLDQIFADSSFTTNINKQISDHIPDHIPDHMLNIIDLFYAMIRNKWAFVKKLRNLKNELYYRGLSRGTPLKRKRSHLVSLPLDRPFEPDITTQIGGKHLVLIIAGFSDLSIETLTKLLRK